MSILPVGVGNYEFGMNLEFGLCLADGKKPSALDNACAYPAVSDLGYCLVCHYELFWGRLPSGYIQADVSCEIHTRKEEEEGKFQKLVGRMPRKSGDITQSER